MGVRPRGYMLYYAQLYCNYVGGTKLLSYSVSFSWFL